MAFNFIKGRRKCRGEQGTVQHLEFLKAEEELRSRVDKVIRKGKQQK